MNNTATLSSHHQENGLWQVSFTSDGEFLEDNFEKLPYKNGQIIFHEHSTPFGLYYISSGRVKLFKIGSDGKEQIIKIAKSGDFLGYTEILGGTKYATSATALEDTKVCFVPKDDFQQLLNENKVIGDTFLKRVCQDLMDAEVKITDIAYKPVRGRLAEALLDLQDTYQNKVTGKTIIPISREDLAHIVGTAKETVIRLLSEFKVENLVRTEGRKIMVTDPSGLVRVSNLYN